MLDVEKEVRAAEKRIRPHVRRTFLEHSAHFSKLAGAEVHFKLENLQHTGSFKVRGAINKVLSLTMEQMARGVVTASTGNHGLAVTFALRSLGASGTIFVPENASPNKVGAIRRLGAEVQTAGEDPVEAEAHARSYAAERGAAYVPPYNDPLIIGGQGTIGFELEQQLDEFDALFVSLGGGGLISGIAGYIKSVRPEVDVIGCSPENSRVMIESVKAGRILEMPSLPTISDGTAGGVEEDSITFELCRSLVDEYVTVSEDEIRESLRLFMRSHHMLIEGAAAVAVASLGKLRRAYRGKKVVIVICGANIDLDTLKSVL
jgi:threonine dehydratase